MRRLTKESRKGFRSQSSKGSFLRLATQSPSHMSKVVKMNNKAGLIPQEQVLSSEMTRGNTEGATKNKKEK